MKVPLYRKDRVGRDNHWPPPPRRISRAAGPARAQPRPARHNRGSPQRSGSAKRAKACRLARLSPRLTRQAHSRRIEEAKPSSSAGVEVVVGVAEHAAEQPVDLLGGDRRQRQPAGQVDVADRVEAEVDPVHAAAALEQEPVERGVVLVRLPAEERLHVQAVRADDQPGHGGQLVLALEPDQVGARAAATRRELRASPGPPRPAGDQPPGRRLLRLSRRPGRASSVDRRRSPRSWPRRKRRAAGRRSRPSRTRDACSRAPAREPGQRPAARSGPERRAQRAGSCPSTSTPETPSRTAVRSPPTDAATTGVPQACASTRDQAERLRAGRHHDHRGGPVPVGQLRLRAGRLEPDMPEIPSAAASSASRSGSARPVPLGPPTNATTSRPASAGSSRISCGRRAQHHVAAPSAAGSARRRPAPPRRRAAPAAAGRPLRARRKTARSTPGLMVLTRDGSAA